MELSGATALVTGGARRIGRAIALRLAEAGCHLVLHHSASPDEADETRRQAEALGVRVHVVCADLRDATAPAELFRTLGDAPDVEGVRVLVNNAASFVATPFDAVTAAAWDEEMALNLRAPFLLTQEFARQQSALGGEGCVINVGDVRVQRPGTDHPVYRLTKTALSALTRDLALTLAPRIRVNEVALGSILPPPGLGDDYLEGLREQIPLRQTGTPGDVAEAVHFLACQAFLTGVTVPVDGGQYL